MNRRRTPSRMSLLALGTLLFAAPAAAQSEEDEQRARVHFEAGRLHYEEGRFARAAEEFEQAHELSGKADLLYNVFIARRDAGQIEGAVEALETYLTEVPDQPNRSKLEARLAGMRAQLEERGASDGSADVLPAPDTEKGEASGFPVGPIATMGAGGALLVSALITGIMAKGAESDLDDACPGRVNCDPADVGIRDRMNRLGLATDILWITGAAAAAGGLVWWLLTRRKGEALEEPAVSVGCGPGTCAMSYRGTF
jgi:tetratricopeptide (TPR) repeat protein